ncbi:MAG: TolC family protein [Planctomycetota bacterium]|jgi:outer membrane protein TolC
MTRHSLNLWKIAIPAIAMFAMGCRTANRVHDPEYARDVHRIHHAGTFSSGSELAPVVNELGGPHSVDTYIRHALTQNPDIQAARKQVEATAFRVPQASSLQDPTFQMTTYPEPVQTAAGQQELLLNVSQKFPWSGKLQAQADVAEFNTNVARAQLAAVELSVIEEVKQAYYELYFAQQSIRITEADRALLVDLTKIADSKYRTGTASQQDVLRAQLEVSNLENELIRLRQELQSTQARLNRRLHVSPDTPVLALDRLPAEQIPSDLQLLYAKATESRPELHAQLAAIQRDRQAVERARLDYYPDPTLGLTWVDTATAGISPVANGRDAVLIGVGFNMPIYRKRIEASVREAEAQTVADARRYDSLKDQTQEQVKDLFTRAQSQQELLKLFREDIIPKADQTLRVSSAAYQTGDVDFLQLIDNWRQLLKFQLAYRRLESQVRQTLASLERVVGGFEAYEEATRGNAATVEAMQPPLPERDLPAIPPVPRQ